MEIPNLLRELLTGQYGEELACEIIRGFQTRRPVTLRVNRLKAEPDEYAAFLSGAGIAFRTVPWSGDAFIIENAREPEIRELELYSSGKIYLQSLSSMIPPLVLCPKEGESVLDMAAAPGGKTTQMAAMTCGSAEITACEKNKIRAARLRYNLAKQGAGRVSVMVEDARRLDDFFRFDKILLDAPCSGSGTVTPEICDFSEDLYNRSRRFQLELLRKALRLLKPGHRMVYSTCSILRGENEDIVIKALSESGARLIPIPPDAFEGARRLPTALDGALCICPDGLYEGFFTALIER